MALGGVWGKQLEIDPLDAFYAWSFDIKKKLLMTATDNLGDRIRKCLKSILFPCYDLPPEIKYDENVATCMKSMQRHHKLAYLLLLANHRHPFLYIVPLSRTPRKFITESPYGQQRLLATSLRWRLLDTDNCTDTTTTSPTFQFHLFSHIYEFHCSFRIALPIPITAVRYSVPLLFAPSNLMKSE
ncbi:uncharacterized protein EAE97_010502 [Botrytis byssoidea]|uniref:Uncharacterized protein n=1 Tax=Botrytis byssoidea TaxID=139641 RepID=A0A9P5HX17_9HELO|nr:uncharacterized protein EAE97_010502 [Botrytis byssoidea]KAF7925421.1 hypothetical protein EAE97_010502 [Botrytis byssoidea]